MKAKNFYLISETVRNNVLDAVRAATLDGKTKVSIGAAGSKSARQRGLQWIWYGDVSKSGIGGQLEETPQGVSIRAKEMFAMPLIWADTDKYEGFLEIYSLVCVQHGGNDQFMYRFYDKYLHTEWFNTQEMAEFLTAFQIYYTNHGVNLSDPIDWKLLNN